MQEKKLVRDKNHIIECYNNKILITSKMIFKKQSLMFTVNRRIRRKKKIINNH